MKTTISAAICLLIYVVPVNADFNAQGEESHHIDNLADGPGFGANAIDPIGNPIHDQGTQWAEGQPTNLCFQNTTTNPAIGMGKPYRKMHQWHWHWRRVIVNLTVRLSGLVNRAKAKAEAKAVARGLHPDAIKVPFWDYDPFFWNANNPAVAPTVHHPILISYYNAISPVPYAWDGIFIRYDHFLEAQNNHGFHSFRVGAPAKYEGAFNYYDRIPAGPTFDPCIAWLEGRASWDYVLDIAAAHDQAGRDHVAILVKRILYLWSFEYLLDANVI